MPLLLAFLAAASILLASMFPFEVDSSVHRPPRLEDYGAPYVPDLGLEEPGCSEEALELLEDVEEIFHAQQAVTYNSNP
jgi:hypothetical protein